MIIPQNTQDVSVPFFLRRSSTGSAYTGLTGTGMLFVYNRIGEAPSSIVSGTNLASAAAAHLDYGVYEVSGTAAPGLYRTDWVDAAFASGRTSVVLSLTGTDIDPAHKEIQLTQLPLESGTFLNSSLGVLNTNVLYYTGTTPPNGIDLDVDIVNARIVEWQSGTAAADVQQWKGVDVATPDVAGYPKVTVKTGTGTGELAVIGGRVTQLDQEYNNVLHVGSGQAYATIANAQTAATAGDLIIIHSGSYTDANLGKQDVTYYFAQGAVLTSTGNPCFHSSVGNTRFRIEGYGRLSSNDAIVETIDVASSNISVECNYTSGRVINNAETDVHIEVFARKQSNGTPLIETAGFDSTCILESPILNTSGQLAVVNTVDALAEFRNARIICTGTTPIGGTDGTVRLVNVHFSADAGASGNGLNSPGNVRLLLESGSLYQASTGRPSLSGSGIILVSDGFAYDVDASTATNVIATGGQTIRNVVTSGTYGNSAIKTAVDDKTGYRLSGTGVDDIWDELQTGHTTGSSFGKFLDSQVSTVSTGGLTASQIADAVWDEAQSGHGTADTFGYFLDSRVSQAGTTGTYTADLTPVLDILTSGTYGNAALANSLTTLGTAVAAIPTDSDVSTACGTALASYGAFTLADWLTYTGTAQTLAEGLTEQGLSPDWAAAVLAAGTATTGTILTNVAALYAWQTAGANVTTGTNLDKTGYGLSAAAVDDIWNEPKAGHTIPDTFGDYLDAPISQVVVGTGTFTVTADLTPVLDIIASGTCGNAAIRNIVGTPTGTSIASDIQNAPDTAGVTTLLSRIGVPQIDVSTDIQNIQVAAAGQVSPFTVDKDHTWWFEYPQDLTAVNTLYELVGFSGLLLMDFDGPLPEGSSISIASSVAIQPTGLLVISKLPSADRRGAVIELSTTGTATPQATTYNVAVTVTTADSQTYTRQGRLVLRNTGT